MEYQYISCAVDALHEKGVDIPEGYLQYITPLGWEHITLIGDSLCGEFRSKINSKSLKSLRDKNLYNSGRIS